jgi:hypothetical protein
VFLEDLFQQRFLLLQEEELVLVDFMELEAELADYKFFLHKLYLQEIIL